MRGKVKNSSDISMPERITPAYAGKRQFTKTRRLLRRDHPRLCGEKHTVAIIIVLVKGSPPPMRGKGYLEPFYSIYHMDHPRLCGEKVSLNYTQFQKIKDHPRLCGEKGYFKMIWNNIKGSPPPMRGKDGIVSIVDTAEGITPAYAGKRSGQGCVKRDQQDHPRLCGEKTKKILKQRYFFHQPASFSFSLQYT